MLMRLFIRAFPGWAVAAAGALTAATTTATAAPETVEPPLVELPYADPAGGRERYRYAEAPVNAYRLYDFYARQADYYLGLTGQVPRLLPAFPGLDGGHFGHWGKYSQNDLSEDRWNRIDSGAVVAAVTRGSGMTVVKGVNVRLGRYGEISACFDPETASYRAVWAPGFLRFGENRFGLVEGATADGEPFLRSDAAADVTAYHGYYKHGERAVFRYSLGGTEVLDAPWSIYSRIGKVFTRTLRFPAGVPAGRPLRLPLFAVPEGLDEHATSEIGRARFDTWAKKDDAVAALVWPGEGSGGVAVSLDPGDRHLWLTVASAGEGTQLKLFLFGGNRASLPFFRAKTGMDDGPGGDDVVSWTGPGEPQWDWGWEAAGERGTERRPYVVDTIPVPLENPFGSMMFLSGHDFFADGTTAAVCTMMGDVWTVAGIDGGLGKVRWRRFATGLNQPMGLCISEEKVYVLGKDQITRLHDLDGDGEADSYENFCNRFATSPGGHDYNTGLQRDGAGNFYFATKHAGLFQVSPDGTEVRTIASGFRNPNGVGVNENGVVTTGGQEGDWVPASSVIEVSAGRFYGYRGERGREVATPLCFVPRGIDNSTSGQAFIETGGRWGPVEGQIISLSYGAGTYYLVLREAFAGGSQGAVVPMDGDFLAGPNRARFNPADGQLYVTCSDGWGDYAMQDGAFHRVRFTGLPFLKPVGFSVHENGLAVSFAEPVAADAAADVTRYFAQQWEYQYSPGYGSPELSLKEPGTIGHDRVDVRSAHLVGDGRTVFVEIPEIRPVMQFHLRLHLETASGEAFRAELFPTIHRLGAPFTGFAGYRPVPPDLAAAKPESLVMRLVWPGDDPLKKSAPDEDAPGREIVIKAIPGLRYDTKEIRARAGERLSVTLVNEDAIPHNFVLAMPGRLHQVGDLANRMLNDPNAVKKQYVPDTDQVIDFIPVINEGEQETLHLNAPKSPGEYPFLCTFPGHYLLMNGVLVVEK